MWYHHGRQRASISSSDHPHAINVGLFSALIKRAINVLMRTNVLGESLPISRKSSMLHWAADLAIRAPLWLHANNCFDKTCS